MDYKLIAMDLDGTITQHRSKLDIPNKSVLGRLRKEYSLVMVVAGTCQRVFEQMGHYPIDIIGNYGLQYAEVIDDRLIYIKNEQHVVNKKDFINKTHIIRTKYGYTNYTGEPVEFHDSGVVTFPLLGTKANLEDKLVFDPDGSIRSSMHAYVSSQFPNYNCFIGGSTSFDIVPNNYDKAKALEEYCSKKRIDFDKVLYLGDDFKKGGNDEPIALSPFDYLIIRDYRSFETSLKKAGILE